MAEQRSPVDGAPLARPAWNAGLQTGIAAAGGEPAEGGS